MQCSKWADSFSVYSWIFLQDDASDQLLGEAVEVFDRFPDVVNEDDGILKSRDTIGTDAGAKELAAEQGRKTSDLDRYIEIAAQQGDSAIAVELERSRSARQSRCAGWGVAADKKGMAMLIE